MNKKNSFIISGLVAVTAIAGVIVYMNSQQKAATPSTAVVDHSKMSMPSDSTPSTGSESDTYKKYAALKGEEYDKAFIANMIVHHESAMNMAELARAMASHQQIKDLSMNITLSQGKEVADMTAWQKQWGYPATSGHNMTDMENASGSMEGMATMNDELKDLSGNAFDKKFLELMIEHHQGAIDMAKPAEANASHQEVKDLAKAIITAQTKEISQMEQWQKEWGFKSA